MPTDPRNDDPDEWSDEDFEGLTQREERRMIPVREQREPLDFDDPDRERRGWWPDTS